MLDISRRVGHTVVMGNPEKPLGTIRVKEVLHNRVVLTFENFHEEFPIHRSEVAEEILQERMKARELRPVKTVPLAAAVAETRKDKTMHEAIAIVEFRNFPPRLYRVKSDEPISEILVASFFEEVHGVEAPDNVTLFEANELTDIEI